VPEIGWVALLVRVDEDQIVRRRGTQLRQAFSLGAMNGRELVMVLRFVGMRRFSLSEREGRNLASD
jgi:hypothetical protein